MRWAEQQRLAFIGERLLAGTTVNRKDIMEKFSVSTPQASLDLRHFDERHPGAMKYDNRRKCYVPHRMQTAPATGRDTTAAARHLMYADNTELSTILAHDPGMIRDVAAALIWERT